MFKLGMDIVCVSHLRWDFVFQRPQHLLSRAARHGRVCYVEEPTFDDGPSRIDVTPRDAGLRVVVPVLERTASREAHQAFQQSRLQQLVADELATDYVLWSDGPATDDGSHRRGCRL